MPSSYILTHSSVFFKLIKSVCLVRIDVLWFLVWQNFDLESIVYISSQAFYAGVDPFNDFE